MISSDTPILEIRGICKSYGPVKALENVSLSVRPGEALALVGDNGAGKSTIVKIISGVTSPDQGEILINGQPIRIHGPLGAQSHGIQTVYQDLALFDNLSVTANLFLGREKVKGRILNERDMEDAARKTFDRLNVKTVDSVRRTVGVMSGGQRQVVAIARAVLADSKVVLLDEPTAALGVEQTAMVLQLVRNLCNQGIGVILVSHSLPHVMEVSDRISVLRLGRWVADFDTSKTNTEEIVSAITGSLTHVKH